MAAIAIDEPPSFWLRLAPAGALELALAGELSAGAVWRLLGDARIFALSREHRPTRAVVDLTYATALPADALEFITGHWSAEMARLGCLRVALVLRSEVLWQKWAPPPAEVELFDGRAAADAWLARAGAPSPPKSASPAPLPGPVLAARCTAEAHLFLDVRGVLPDRQARLVPTPQGEVLVLTGDVAGEAEPASFAFHVAEPDGQLGQGGVKGPSAILGPSELIVWADILSKRNPASPEGLSPAQRAAARSEMLAAARCMEEVLKFVPAGASAVPAAAFEGPVARRVYDKEPGRFDAARLEAVAQAYRRVLARFG